MQASKLCLAGAVLSLLACNGSSSNDTSSGGTSGADLPDRVAPPEDSGSSGTGTSGTSGTSGMPVTDAATDASDGGNVRDLTPNKAAFFGASRCAQAGVKLCEDFESGTLDAMTWTTVGAKPVIDGVQHARGAKALHVTVNGNGASYIKETKSFPAPNNAYWGRMFVWFDSLPVPAAMFTYAHWTFAAATGTQVPGEIRLSGQMQNGKNLFGVGTDNRTANGTGDWTSSDKDPMNAPLAVPTKQWLCIEWAHLGNTNETRFYWDAVEHPSLYTTSTKNGGNGMPYILPQFDALWVGWNEYQTATEKFELWIDEVAVDQQRIGCVL
ncbi:MAG: hypothetical protein JWO86_3413 [Myxococcaceae bacterium]|nr:hypothetical protein [Myxococcaceae bacterium]